MRGVNALKGLGISIQGQQSWGNIQGHMSQTLCFQPVLLLMMGSILKFGIKRGQVQGADMLLMKVGGNAP